MHPIQAKYFTFLKQVSAHSNYLQCFLEQAERVDRSLSIGLAILSNASVAGWFIWAKLGCVWPVLVGIANIANITKTYLPYSKRLDALKESLPEFKRIAHRTETEWYKVWSGTLTTKQIDRLINTLQKEQLDIEERLFKKTSIPFNQIFIDSASVATDRFIKTYYGR